MPDKYIVEHCSPTLAGLKTANLFSIKIKKGQDICGELRELNATLTKKGLCAIPLRRTEKNVLIYLFRPDYLKRDLGKPEVRRILRQKGYSCDDPKRCIVELIGHLAEDETFPHEIGLFLGYPAEDVEGFMASPCRGVKCSGCWKAYGNEDKARETFSRYRKCTDVYRRVLASGRPLAQMIVQTASPQYKGR